MQVQTSYLLSRTHAQSIDKAQNTMANMEPLHTRFSYFRNWYEIVVNEIHDTGVEIGFVEGFLLHKWRELDIQPSLLKLSES